MRMPAGSVGHGGVVCRPGWFGGRTATVPATRQVAAMSEVGEKPSRNTNRAVVAKMVELYNDLVRHDGYGEVRVEIKIMRRGQKEVIIHCGKQYRYVVDYPGDEVELA